VVGPARLPRCAWGQADAFVPAARRKNRDATESITRTGEFQLETPGEANQSARHAENMCMRFVKLVSALFGTGLCIGLLKGA
jgi:hypothetical protein